MELLTAQDRDEIARLWTRKLDQDARGLPQQDRHRNLEPPSAEFLCALAAGVNAYRILEIGGSSGLSTIALAAAARFTKGRVVSIEMEPLRQAEAKNSIAKLGLAPYVEFVLADAASIIPEQTAIDLAFIDCEKEDYTRFFDMLRMASGGIIVADNILSHNLTDYVAHVRKRPDVESITLPIGKGLEVSRLTT